MKLLMLTGKFITPQLIRINNFNRGYDVKKVLKGQQCGRISYLGYDTEYTTLTPVSLEEFRLMLQLYFKYKK